MSTPYEKRNTEELPNYEFHLNAIIQGHLIPFEERAAELAYRDKRIEDLEKKLKDKSVSEGFWITRAVQESAKAHDLTTWKPIEEAPKDGSRIIVGTMEDGELCFVQEATKAKESEGWLDWWGGHFEPTHYLMRVPEMGEEAKAVDGLNTLTKTVPQIIKEQIEADQPKPDKVEVTRSGDGTQAVDTSSVEESGARTFAAYTGETLGPVRFIPRERDNALKEISTA